MSVEEIGNRNYFGKEGGKKVSDTVTSSSNSKAFQVVEESNCLVKCLEGDVKLRSVS